RVVGPAGAAGAGGGGWRGRPATPHCGHNPPRRARRPDRRAARRARGRRPRRRLARRRPARGPAEVSGLRAAGGPVIPNFGQGTACLRHNHWFCPSWVREHWGDTFQPALIQHIELTVMVVGIGFVIAFLLALVGFRWRILEAPIGAGADV